MLLSGIFMSLLIGGSLGTDLPKGHLEPFGGHRPPDVDIVELYDLPDPQTFWDEYVKDGKAAIFRGAATKSPGFKLWTEEFLSQEYGNLEVRLEGKCERNSGIPTGEKGIGRDTLRSFLKTFRDKDTYIVSQLPEPMYRDFFIPPSIACGNMRDRIVEIDLWMSSGNTHSIIHKDAFNAVNCLMKGTKYWKLIEYEYEKWLYKTWEPKREIGGNSRVNAHSIDLLKYPDIAKIRWSNITINAGDCLFLPKSYYHQVSSYGDPNLAVSVLFSRISSFDPTGCDVTPIEFTPLSEVDVLWSWPGHGVMSMGNLDVWMLKANHLQYAKEHGQLTPEDLTKDMRQTFPELDADDIKNKVSLSWRALDKSGKGFLTPGDIEALDTDSMREHCLGLEFIEPSNTEEYEYSYINANDIQRLLEALSNALPEGVSRPTFISHYVKQLGGTEKYANEVFDGLVGNASDLATSEQIAANMDAALKPWREAEGPETSPEIDDQYDLEDIDLFKEEGEGQTTVEMEGDTPRFKEEL